MRILLDCSRLVVGGGMQVGLSVLKAAAGTAEHEWYAVLSSPLSAQVPEELATGFAGVWRMRRSNRITTQFRESLLDLPRIERETRPDLVFTVFGPILWRARAPHLVGFAVPYLLYPESLSLFLRTPRERLRMKLVLGWCRFRARRATYWTVQTDTVKRRLQHVLGCPLDKIVVVRNTYSQLFTVGTPPDGGGKRTEQTFRIAVPSAAYGHKNLEIVPRVAERLRAEGRSAFEFVFTLDPDCELWRKLAKIADHAGVGANLRTAGVIPNAKMQPFYAAADATFLPTLLECSSAVYPESFMAGVPVVTSELDFARELCAEAALYCDPLSSDEGAAALARLMDDPGLRIAMAEAGRKVLTRNYPTPAEQWQEYLRCFAAVKAMAGG